MQYFKPILLYFDTLFFFAVLLLHPGCFNKSNKFTNKENTELLVSVCFWGNFIFVFNLYKCVIIISS